ncbi:tol-pal system protein YbgF [Maioricimonas rarisocia]|uniref:Tol-pal system protein YbgF n=1 Tax=Maioricimonas rarisocia TaxID=2528026 RepID=A0A517ZD44_9PLAN|nr:tetratricopeptide repeat protein [Maioricimonas rarisocia]QDU40398.1 tol-pal system protein YbgF [Maioricimonas rarisocia]
MQRHAEYGLQTGQSGSLRTLIVALTLLASVMAAPVPARADAIDDYNVAIEFYRQQRYDQAAEAFRAYLEAHPQHNKAPLAQLYYGQSLVYVRKFEPARNVFRSFVTKYPDHPDTALARYRVAESSFFLGDLPAAQKDFASFLSRHPDHELAEWALQYLGEAQLRAKNVAEAAQTFERYLDKYPDGRLADDSRFGLARAYEALKKPEQAIPLYQTLASRPESPRAADAQFNLGARYFEDGNYEEASKAFAAVGERFPRSSLAGLAALNAGFADYRLDRFDAAVEHFRTAAASPEQAATAGFWIGLSLKSRGDFAAAAEQFQQMFDQAGEAEQGEKILFHWADSQFRAQNFQQAEELFLRQVQQWPEGELADDALHTATEAAIRDGRLDDAEQLSARFRNDYPDSGLMLLQELLDGRRHLAAGDQLEGDAAAAKYRDAVAVFESVLRESSVDRTRMLASVQLAQAYNRLGDHQRVRALLEPVMKSIREGSADPDVHSSLVLLANSLIELQQYRPAAEAADLYLEVAPNGADAGRALAAVARARAHLQERLAVQTALEQMARRDPPYQGLPAAVYEVAEIAYDQDDWDWSTELFDQLITLGPDSGYHAAALAGLGYSLHEAGQFDRAAETFNTLLETHPEDWELASTAAYMRGLALQSAGKSEQAATAFLKGASQFALDPSVEDPTDEQLAASLNAYRSAKGAARVLRELKKVDESDKAYESAYNELKRQPEDRQDELDKLINEWALLSYESEDYARSDELFAMLVKERPGSDLADDAKLYLGESDYFAGKLDQASQRFQELLAGDDADEFVQHRALVLLLDIAADQQDWEQLLASSRQLASKFPESEQLAYARYREGEALLQSGKVDEAIEILTELKGQLSASESETRPEWAASVWLLLAEARLRNKDYAGVEQTVSDFRTANPDSPLLYQADEILGRSYKNRAMFAEARDAFARVTDSETGRRTETAAKAQFHLAETHLIEKNFDAALREYYKVYTSYQFPEWQAPALFQAARSDEALGNWEGAIKSYEKLVAEFPESQFAKDAVPRLEIARQKVGSGSP